MLALAKFRLNYKGSCYVPDLTTHDNGLVPDCTTCGSCEIPYWTT